MVEYNSGDCNGTFEHGSHRNHCWRMTSAAMTTAHVSANGRAEPLVYLTKSELSTSFVRSLCRESPLWRADEAAQVIYVWKGNFPVHPTIYFSSWIVQHVTRELHVCSKKRHVFTLSASDERKCVLLHCKFISLDSLRCCAFNAPHKIPPMSC